MPAQSHMTHPATGTSVRRLRMMKQIKWSGMIVLLLALLAAGVSSPAAQARMAAQPDPPNPAFQRVWERADRPVAEGRAARSWTWGPAAIETRREPYKETPGGARQVQYYDKARMEVNNPNGDPNNPFFVTNGRRVVELRSGRIQSGDNQ